MTSQKLENFYFVVSNNVKMIYLKTNVSHRMHEKSPIFTLHVEKVIIFILFFIFIFYFLFFWGEGCDITFLNTPSPNVTLGQFWSISPLGDIFFHGPKTTSILTLFIPMGLYRTKIVPVKGPLKCLGETKMLTKTTEDLINWNWFLCWNAYTVPTYNFFLYNNNSFAFIMPFARKSVILF